MRRKLTIAERAYIFGRYCLFALGMALGLSGAVYAQAIQPSALRQIQTILQEKLNPTPAQRKLDSHLHLSAQLVRGVYTAATMPGIENASKRLEFDEQKRVHVDVQGTVSGELLDDIAFLGGTVESSFPEYGAIRAWIPLLEVTYKGDAAPAASRGESLADFGPPPALALPRQGVLVAPYPTTGIGVPFLSFHGIMWVVFFYAVGYLAV
jgi:hypothetical protein